MKKIANFFILLSMHSLNIAKWFSPSTAFDYMGYFSQEFMKASVNSVEVEIDGEVVTIEPEKISLVRTQ